MLKRSDLGPIWTSKNDFANFFVFAKIFTKNVCPRSQRLHRHVSALSTTTRISCQRRLTHMKLFFLRKSKHLKKCKKKWNLIFSKIACLRSCWLRGHGVGVVNDYADTSMTTWTLFENFEGFSKILKEQSGKKRYLGVFTHQIAII